MLKQFILTTLGILLSFVIAIGGWVSANRLMDMRADNLMSVAGVSPILMPLQLPQTDIPHDPEQYQDPTFYAAPRFLPEQNIISVLHNHAAPGREIPHDPGPGQITMQEAIEIGREWLGGLEQHIYFHPSLLNFHDPPSAFLIQNIQRLNEGFLPPEYSFWNVTFSSMFMTATLLINAVEGRVWRTDLTLSPRARAIPLQDFQRSVVIIEEYTEFRARWESVVYFETTINNAMNILDDFVYAIGIDTRDSLVWPPPPALGPFPYVFDIQRHFFQGRGYAALRISGSALASDRWYITNLSLYLGLN